MSVVSPYCKRRKRKSRFIILPPSDQINKVQSVFWASSKKEKRGEGLQASSKVLRGTKCNAGVLRFNDDDKRAAVAHHLKHSVLLPKGLPLDEVIFAAPAAIEQRAVEGGFLEVAR